MCFISYKQGIILPLWFKQIWELCLMFLCNGDFWSKQNIGSKESRPETRTNQLRNGGPSQPRFWWYSTWNDLPVKLFDIYICTFETISFLLDINHLLWFPLSTLVILQRYNCHYMFSKKCASIPAAFLGGHSIVLACRTFYHLHCDLLYLHSFV